jgi:hypothetical protein
VVLAALSGLWLLVGFRWLGIPLLTAVVVLIATGRTQSRVSVAIWVTFVVVMLLPLDVSLRIVPGGPRIVPYVMGLPNRQLRERAARGEVALGGCVVSGLEPRWVIVW